MEFLKIIKFFVKNFIIFIILLKQVFKKNNPVVFVKPKYCNTLNILRAPYKNKISKHQITLSRFFIVVSFKFKFEKFIYLSGLSSIFLILKKLKNFYSFFETNITYQHKSVLTFSFFLKNFFLLNKYV